MSTNTSEQLEFTEPELAELERLFKDDEMHLFSFKIFQKAKSTNYKDFDYLPDDFYYEYLSAVIGNVVAMAKEQLEVFSISEIVHHVCIIICQMEVDLEFSSDNPDVIKALQKILDLVKSKRL